MSQDKPSLSARRFVYELLMSADATTRAARLVRGGLSLLIIANVAMVVLETVPALRLRLRAAFHAAEAFSVAIFTAARLLPMMLGPIAGVVSDRFDRPKLLLFASGWAFCAISTVALLVALDRISFWGLVFGGLCVGLAQSPSQPARFSLVAELVGRKSLSNANALNSIVFSMTQVIGPALGGAMIAAFGAAAALAISALWYLVSFLTLWPLRRFVTRARVPSGKVG